MGIKLANNANATLAAGINSSATSITVTTGQGARFPTLSVGDYFFATLIDTSNNLEIVKVTARSTDVLTVTRAQESTTARAYSAGDRIELRLTAQTFTDATVIPDGDKGEITTSSTVWTIDNNAITTAKVADGAITTAKIPDGAITTAKLASGAGAVPNVYRVDNTLRSSIQSTSGSYTDNISVHLTSKTYAVILRVGYMHNGGANHGYWTVKFYQSGKNGDNKNVFYFDRAHFDWYFNVF
jgi:hypothetical protein